jgi:ABC-type antimicrobial peptide transport system permease subunit
MINLLPTKEKDRLISEGRERLVIIWGIVISVSLACMVLILFSLKFYILAKADQQKSNLIQAQQDANVIDSDNLLAVIKNSNNVLRQVDSFYKSQLYLGKTLESIFDVSDYPNLFLTSVSLVCNNNLISVSISGVSQTRETLLLYKKDIENNKFIKNPVFPPENWVNAKNINFSLTFSIDKNVQQ